MLQITPVSSFILLASSNTRDVATTCAENSNMNRISSGWPGSVSLTTYLSFLVGLHANRQELFLSDCHCQLLLFGTSLSSDLLDLKHGSK